jgi:DNA repair protein RadC
MGEYPMPVTGIGEKQVVSMVTHEKEKKAGGIKYWPASERPREVLLEKGPEFVSDAGLLAIILRTGIKGKDAVSLGRELLDQFGGLRGILGAKQNDLRRIRGLGAAKAAQLLAAIEISRRQLKENIFDRRVIRGPEDVADYLSLSMADKKEEVFRVLYLNSAHMVLTIEDVCKGTIDQSAVYPREVIKGAFDAGAAALIFVHNHPSGNLEPSEQDLLLTRKLIDACRAVDLKPLDHLIVGPAGYTSFKERGLVLF